MNDTADIEGARQQMINSAWFFIVLLPAAMLFAACYYELDDVLSVVLMVGGYIVSIIYVRSEVQNSLSNNQKKSE